MSVGDVTSVRADWPNPDLDSDPGVGEIGGCPGCGKPLIGKQTYCSDACRKRVKRATDAGGVTSHNGLGIEPDEVIGPGAGPIPRTRPKQVGKPRPGKRQDTSEMLGGLWGVAASFLVPQFSPAMGRGMTFTQPAAGPVLDDALAGSPLDKHVLQKFAGVGRKVSGARDLFTIPAMLFMAERKPAILLAPPFQKAFRGAVREQLSTVVEAMKKQRALEEELNQAAYELGMKEDPDSDILDQICRDLLGPLLAD